jgi:8-oxo-dGTP pyrophosphatase MutT (NUDIX family)
VTGFYFGDRDAPTPNRPRRVGVAALIEHDGHLLLDRRVDPPGWGLIAGTAGEEESLPDALEREIDEETGLGVLSSRLFGVFSDPSRIVRYADGNTYRPITVVFLVEPDNVAKLRPSPETAELQFVPKHDLPTFDVIATHRPIIDLYMSPGTPPYVD